MSVFDCAGVLYIALRYDMRMEPERTATYLDNMSMLPWLGLGEPLQQSVTRALLSLRDHFGR